MWQPGHGAALEQAEQHVLDGQRVLPCDSMPVVGLAIAVEADGGQRITPKRHCDHRVEPSRRLHSMKRSVLKVTRARSEAHERLNVPHETLARHVDGHGQLSAIRAP